MTREETKKILMGIQSVYPNFHPVDKTTALDLWTECLEDLPYEKVAVAVKEYIMTETKGFAPTIGQIRERISSRESINELTDSQAWEMVYKALCGFSGDASKEFNELPPDVQRAVGGAEQLREWGYMNEDSISVAESNFRRTYRAIMEKKERYRGLPDNMRPMIEATIQNRIDWKGEEAV